MSALKCDPDLIYEFVYNNIEFEPLYGSNKGALGTLLDRRGDDADQVILLDTLWNIAGYPATGYANGTLPFSGAEISNWLGVPNDATAIANLLHAGGIPYNSLVANGDGTLNSINVQRFLSALQLSGTWYFFDPTFKSHTIVSGIGSLAVALGYNRSQFLSDAGGTFGPNSISSVNRVALRSDLTTYAQNLNNYINGNNRTRDVGNIIGGKRITPLTGSPIRVIYGVTPDTTFPTDSSPDCPNQTPSNVDCRTQLTIVMPGASTSQAIRLYTDQVYGHRITISSVGPSGGMYVPTLLVDGEPPACVGTGACTNVGPATAAGGEWDIQSWVTQPNQSVAPGTSCPSGVSATYCKTLTVAAGGTYLVSLGVGQIERGMAEYHRQLLAQARATGNSDSSELVLGENLAAISYNWIAQVSAEQQMADQITQTTAVYNFAVGITGQANIQQTGYQGPYVDLPVNYGSVIPWSSNAPTIVVGGYSFAVPFLAANFTFSQSVSSLESAVLQQTQAPVADMTAASTVRLIDANMNLSYPGATGTTYFADGTTCAGQSAYTSTIQPVVHAHYAASDSSAIDAAVLAGSTNCPSAAPTGSLALIPSNGQLGVGLWSGAGYTFITSIGSSSVGTQIATVQKISGGLSGGFSGTDIPDPAPNTEITLLPPSDSDTLLTILAGSPSSTNPQTTEPVDAITGSYVYEHDDLVTGSGQFPYALSFSRTYQSATGSNLTTTQSNIGMGNGWLHNYDINTQIESDPYTGMGSTDTPAVYAATSIAALYVMQDLNSVTPTAQTQTVASMVTQWFTDQLTGNVAMVTRPDMTESFVALPHADGATTIGYSPPPASSARMTQTGAGTFTYQTKDGQVLTFGPTPGGALQSWTFPNSMSISLAYNGSSQLTSVANNIRRSLTLAYSGSNVASVTDDTARSVSYAYDANGNLTQFTDPLGSATRFSYDTSGAYDSAGHLTQVFYPSQPSNAFVTNWYDPLGRVIQQANANGFASHFYLAGSRSELVDAAGDRHVTYQTDRGRVLKDAYVLSGTANVYNDTEQDNGTVNVFANQYDGIDRLTASTSPEGVETQYIYATDINPWANNIASVTANPKPGSTLAPLTTSYTYDPVYNTPISIIDPRGLVNLASYDPATGNLLQSVADAGSGHFNATTRFTYNNVGQVLTATDPLGAAMQNYYDGFGNLTAVVRDAGAGRLNQATRLTYDAVGDVVALTDPNGHVTASAYDADRRRVSTILPMTGAAPGPLVTAYAYDPDGRLLQSVQSVNGVALRATATSYTLSGKPATATDPNGHVTRFAYDADDRLTSLTDPVGRITTYGYDALSRRVSVSNPAIQSNPLAQQAYTPDGQIASLTTARDNTTFDTTSFAYDGFDRLGTTTYPNVGSGSTSESLTYDADSNILTRQTRKGDVIAFSYDTLNRVCTKTYATSPVACGGSSSNYLVSYAYDLDNRPVATNDNSAAMTTPSASASYVTDFTYDALNQPLAVSWSPAPAQAMPTASSVSFGFTYDASNRRISTSPSAPSWLDIPSSPSSTIYTANALDQYSTVGTVTPTYDANGNLTFDGTFTYGYDPENRLISASGPGVTASYSYDAQGRRKSKNVNGATTAFVTDADNREVVDYDGASGAIENAYTFGLGPNDALNQINVGTGTRATFTPDVQGSLVATLDSGTGTLTTAGFQTYGESSTTSGTFRYTGARIDAETNGLYNFRARMYSPLLGRFLQADPSGTQGGNNLYAYVGNDPLNNVDLFGLAADSPQENSASVSYAVAGPQLTSDVGGNAGDLAALTSAGLVGVNIVGFPKIGVGLGLISSIPAQPQIQLAQEVILPAELPPWLTPLEEVPKGTQDGPGAGKPFPRSFNEQQPPDVPCTYCSEPTTREPGPDQLQGDHIIPRSQGGSNSPENYAPSCRTCNLQKGPRTPEEWYRALQNGSGT